MTYGGLVYSWQWALPSVFLGFAEELTIATMVLSTLYALYSLWRGRLWMAALVMAGSSMYAHSVRAGRVVEPGPTVGKGRVAVVTGSNQGLGKATALLLVQAGYHVVICSRNLDAGERAAQEIRTLVPGGSLDVMELHLAPLSRVRDFHRRLAARYSRVDLLVNNAGGGFFSGESALTPDGLSWILGINHVAHHYLTLLTLPELNASPSPRIVTLGSIMAHIGEPHADWYHALQTPNPVPTLEYADSKLANVLFARSMARKYPHIATVSASPGFIWTNLLGGGPVVQVIARALRALVIKNEREGAMTPYIAATETPIVNGAFYSDGFARPHPWQASEKQAEILWNATERIIVESITV